MPKEKTMMKYFMLVVVAFTLVSSPAFAAKTTRHCVDKDKKEISLTGVGGKKAQCKAAGGRWVKLKAASTTTTTTKTK
jgi:hypothetical protein